MNRKLVFLGPREEKKLLKNVDPSQRVVTHEVYKIWLKRHVPIALRRAALRVGSSFFTHARLIFYEASDLRRIPIPFSSSIRGIQRRTIDLELSSLGR